MVWRHREYVTLYRANLDSEHPVDFATLRRQLAEAENGYVYNRNSAQKSTPNIEEHNILFLI